MTFGEKLQALRQKAGMSQDALAEKLNVSRQAVSRWERDETMPETDKVIALADLFGVTHVINTGIAGSLDPELDIGEIAISTDLIYHDFDAGAFGYSRGQVPGMDTHSFPADAAMGDLAQEVCTAQGLKCKKGRIVSGDQFVADPEKKADITTHVGGLCTEMEGAAIAHAAYRNGIPVLVLRAISDKADDSADMDYPTFERMAAEHSAQLVEALVQKI